jgi:hypothetical protein
MSKNESGGDPRDLIREKAKKVVKDHACINLALRDFGETNARHEPSLTT